MEEDLGIREERKGNERVISESRYGGKEEEGRRW